MSDEMIGPVSFLVGFVCCGIPVIAGVLATPFVVMFLWNKRQVDLVEDLKATGYPGEALILNVQHTGYKLFTGRGGRGGIPRWYVTMEVHIPNFPAYQVTKTLTLGEEQVARIPAGTVITVLADPKVPQKIGIVWDPEILKSLPRRQ